MSDFYEYESSGARCLRSSPVAALMAFLIVLLGATGFGVGTTLARNRIIELLDGNHLFPYLDYTVYGIVAATGLFIILCYIISVISSGWNAKRCFEGSKKTSCGRCLNITLLVFLIFGIIIWVLMTALLLYPITSMALLLYRDSGPIRSVALNRPIRQSEIPQPYPLPAPPIFNEPKSEEPAVGGPGPVVIQPRGSQNIMGNPSEIISNYFKCSENMIDLSYYGFYDDKGFPKMMSSAHLDVTIRSTLVFASLALLGSLCVVFGFLLMLCSVAINYTRLKEIRYYDPSDNDDETIRLRH